jgi:hypothetical protein
MSLLLLLNARAQQMIAHFFAATIITPVGDFRRLRAFSPTRPASLCDFQSSMPPPCGNTVQNCNAIEPVYFAALLVLDQRIFMYRNLPLSGSSCL